MINIIAPEGCSGCGVILGPTAEVEQLDFTGKSFLKNKTIGDEKLK